jgi:hypothetical protein
MDLFCLMSFHLFLLAFGRDAKSEPVIADPFVSEGVEIEANDDPDGANCAICRLIYAELKEGLQGI